MKLKNINICDDDLTNFNLINKQNNNKNKLLKKKWDQL